MKKIFLIAVVAVLALAYTSCTGNDTPTQLCEKALKCIQEKDYDGYLKLVQFKDEGDAEKMKQKTEQFRSLLEDKMNKQLEEKQGIKDFKVLEEKIEENKAKVKYQLTWGDGTETTDDMQLIKNSNGKWMLDADK